ncbi:MAG TPA: protein phosphatase 2C domain-containing protein [Actinophytocola sp.]|uniref:protein phosphatase 2C domain-containing protein n=1 Tax=Actinophytocola sp. TaxID=1872138 RepID=UPI002DB5847F|nr:protein phosphatase 2C domain-containing protein [Actinophytocola sp.]HEU5470842.1 protein phosphatase 2C domain-containing protein [Actinophytocola sp.]
MDIQPRARGRAQLWYHSEENFGALAVWTERNPGHGEDADPLVLFRRSSGRGLIAVFDGVGGAGRSVAGRTSAGVDRTQAWVASRRVRALTEEWFVGNSTATILREHIAGRLAHEDDGRGRVRGSMHREFPTTLAGLEFRMTGAEVSWDVLWAGDSRCYVAEPELGLQQLSRDDTQSADALELLVQDPPMTNMVSADRRFELNHWRGRAPLPCLLIGATDGFFGYLDAPALFEHLLWKTLLSAQDIMHWSALLAERVSGYTGDDASLAIVALGFPHFNDLRVHFRERAERVDAEHAVPLALVRPDDRAGLITAREHSWRRYRGDYERRLRGCAEGAPV